MKKILFFTLCASAGLLYYTKPYKTLSTDVVNGESKYKQYCLSCHGERGLGDGLLVGTLEKRPSDINEKFKTDWKPDNRLTRRILIGKPDTGMPAFKNVLSEKDAEDILAYVRTLK
ncbi:MAG: c-type cytochrome [Granulosicoccaceae bacterium]